MKSNPIKMRTNQMICNQIQIKSDHKEGDGPQTQHHSASDSLSHRSSGDSGAAELALRPHVRAFTQTGLPLLIPGTMRATRGFPTLGLREFDLLAEANKVGVGHARGDVSGARGCFAVFAFV